MYNINEIKEQFKSVIRNSQSIQSPKVDKLFKDWEKNKSYFIECFDGNLIYQYPEKIKITLNQDHKEHKILEFAYRVGEVYGNRNLEDFIIKNRTGFFDNEVIDISDFNTDDKKSLKKGMKLLKAFKFFVEDENTLRRIQDDASQIIQSNKLEGYLCVSVHPLDFLSSSENTHNWRSCHALDGEYRSGNLSYMADNSTVICYLKSEEEQPFGHFDFPWNSKKWRMLMHFSDDRQLVMAGRQYPAGSKEIMDIIHEKILKEKFFDEKKANPFWGHNWCNWFDGLVDKVKNPYSPQDTHIHLNSKYICLNGDLHKLEDVVIDYKNQDNRRLHFNDLLRSSCYTPVYSICIKDLIFNNSHPKIHVGAEVNCLHCGEKHIYDGETMYCLDCELQYGSCDGDDFFTCDCCGNRGFSEEAYSVYDDEWETTSWICRSCAENETFVCERCGERHYNNFKKYSQELDDYVCIGCFESL